MNTIDTNAQRIDYSETGKWDAGRAVWATFHRMKGDDAFTREDLLRYLKEVEATVNQARKNSDGWF